MNNYDSMTVDDLMFEYAHWARNEAGTHWEIHGTQGVVVADKNPLNIVARKHAIEAALRRKVIEEASVGTVYVARDGTDGCPEFRFRCAESLTSVSTGNVCQLCRELMPERQYALIPSDLAAKETP